MRVVFHLCELIHVESCDGDNEIVFRKIDKKIGFLCYEFGCVGSMSFLKYMTFHTSYSHNVFHLRKKNIFS